MKCMLSELSQQEVKLILMLQASLSGAAQKYVVSAHGYALGGGSRRKSCKNQVP